MQLGQTIQIKQGASNSELQRTIEAAIPEATKQMQRQAARYKGKSELESCQNIFNFLKNNIHYKADGTNQQVRLPSGLLRTGQGDCKSYTVFTSAILNNLKIPHSLCYVSFNPKDPTPTHIYVITDKGCIIDAVYGKFNKEKKPTSKTLKKMNISIISGIQSPKKIGTYHDTVCGISGIMGTESAVDWGKRNGIFQYQSNKWLFANNGTYRKYAIDSVLPLAISGRLIVNAILKKNGGGLATSLQNLMQDSRTQSPGQPAWEKMRKIELQWLTSGGNPNELYESISDGAKKTPTGQYFNKLMRMKANGYNPNIAQWIAAAISVLFGKKYNEATGKITGSSEVGIGIGDPATTGGLLASAPVWVQFVAYVSGVVGTAYVVSKVGGPNDIPNGTGGDGGGGSNGGGGGGNDGSGSGARSSLLPILLIGGAAAAYFILKPKTKK